MCACVCLGVCAAGGDAVQMWDGMEGSQVRSDGGCSCPCTSICSLCAACHADPILVNSLSALVSKHRQGGIAADDAVPKGIPGHTREMAGEGGRTGVLAHGDHDRIPSWCCAGLGRMERSWC